MSFLYPEFLYYMLPALLLMFGLLLTQKESQEHFFSRDVIEKLRVSSNTLTLKARNALFLIMGFFMILALARPIISDGLVDLKAKSSDIVVAIDISEDMLGSDVYPSRLELAKQKVLTMLGYASGEQVGVMVFAKNVYLVSPLSSDINAVSFLLKELDTTSITEQGTDFFSLIDVVAKAKKSDEKRTLFILSSGGDKKDFSKEIELAEKNMITIFVLGVGTQKGTPIKLKDGALLRSAGGMVISKLNENISDLATKTGGTYIKSTTPPGDVRAMLSEIKRVTKARELKSQKVQKNIELFYIPVGIALFLLLVATSSIRRKEVAVAHILMLSLLLSSTPDLNAGVLDFLDIGRAKSAYEQKDYKNSAKLYEKYAKLNQNSEAFYNSANGYYKQKRYKEAIENYKKASFDSKTKRADNLSNLGNAYVKSGALEMSVHAYEESLKNKEDKNTRENLEAVEKLIKKQKNSSNDKKSSEKNSDSKNNKNSDKKNSDDKNSDLKNSKKADKNSLSNKDNKPEEKGSSGNDLKKSKNNNDDVKTQSKKQEELEKKQNSVKEEDKTSSTKSNQKSKMMSNDEQEKWMQEVNTRKGSYLYKLNEN
ncbi:VWA domain-containing protein [Sulfurimonas sp.]|uniref:vWA domain-containing protein n=1 Tax=Sulfurimonas sp. TaxID=2022749 RepID=UPI0026068DDF|nr:VWA domain-containing protein [Sulfurimonas sp.]MDD5158206.1 VWA domain-containing protein [Sulfurimonas sp.]